MSRTTVLALLCALATVASTTMASAKTTYSPRVLSDAHVGSTKPELQAQMAFSKLVISKITATRVRWQIAPRHATCWSHVPWSKLCNAKRARLLTHRHLLATASAKYARLYPAPARPARPTLDSSLIAAFTCIHGFEGAWDANTGNGYYGGLQMDYGFMSTYGGDYLRQWGTANNWPSWAQLDVAIRAYKSGRGFGPWPNTARYCGLI